MRLQKRSLIHTSGAMLIALSLATGACSSKKSNSSAAPEETDVTFSGSLALTSSDTSLLGDAYQLYCVTFALPPTASGIDNIADGAEFSQNMSGFANTSFGCFLRQNSKVVGTAYIDYDGDSSTTFSVPPGELTFNLVFDPETGSVTFKITGGSSIEKLKGGEGGGVVAATNLSSITGNYALGCLDDAEKADFTAALGVVAENYDLPCMMDGKSKLTLGGDAPEKIHINDVTYQGKRYVGIWESEAAKTACLPDVTNEFAPKFGTKIDGVEVAIDYSSTDKFVASIDAVYAKLPAALKTALTEAVSLQESKRYGWCDQQKSFTYTVENCKFITQGVHPEYKCPVMDKDGQKVLDASGREQMEPCPMWYNSWDEIPASATFTGTAVATEGVECTAPGRQKKEEFVKYWCPHEAVVDAEGKGTMTVYRTEEGKDVLFTCNIDDGKGGNRFEFPRPASDATLAAMVAKMTPPGADQCEDAAAPYAGLKKGSVNELRRIVSDVFRPNHDGGGEDSTCSRYEIPANFTFASCSPNGDGGNQKAVCWSYNSYGLKVGADGSLDDASSAAPGPGGGGGGWFPTDMKDDFCPNATFMEKNEQNPWESEQENQKLCRAEFVAMSAVAQAKALTKMQFQWQVVDGLTCSEDTSAEVKSLIASAQSSGCAAEIRFDNMCFNGKCEVSLDCGTDGGCFDANGGFLGRVTGRMAIMTLNGSDSSFMMAERNVHKYFKWDPETNKQTKCREVHVTEISVPMGPVTDEATGKTELFAAFTSKGDEQCEEEESSDKSSGNLEGRDDERFMMKMTKE